MKKLLFLVAMTAFLTTVPIYAQTIEPKETFVNYEGTYFYDMAYNGERYVAVGSKALLATSTDLENWQPVKGIVDISETIAEVKWNGSEFIAYTYDPHQIVYTQIYEYDIHGEKYALDAIESLHVLRSKDGLTWVKADEDAALYVETDTKIAETDAGDMKYGFRQYDQESPDMFFREKGSEEWVRVENDFENLLDYLYFQGKHYVYTRTPFCVNISEDLKHWESRMVEVENSDFWITDDKGNTCISTYDEVRLLVSGDSVSIICGSYDNYLVATSRDGVRFKDTGNRIKWDAFKDCKYFSFINKNNEKIIVGLSPYKIMFSKNYMPFQEVSVNEDRLHQIQKVNSFPAISVGDFWNGREYMTLDSLDSGFYSISKDNLEWERVSVSEKALKSLWDKGFSSTPVYYPIGLKAADDKYIYFNNGHSARGMSETDFFKTWLLLDRNFNLVAFHRFDRSIADIAYEDGKYIVWLIDDDGKTTAYYSSDGEAWLEGGHEDISDNYSTIYVIHGLYTYIDTSSGNVSFSNNKKNWLEIKGVKVYDREYKFKMKTEYEDYVMARTVYAIGDDLYIRGRDYVYIYSVSSIKKAIEAGSANLS